MSTIINSKNNNWLNIVQYWIFPGTCIVCNKASERNYDLCRACEILLPRIKDPCESCGLPLPLNNYDGKLCGTCIVNPPPYKHIISAFNYVEPVDRLIRKFKYYGKLAYGRVLSRQLLKSILSFYQNRHLPELLIPMPLHKCRLHQRGFNQAVEIAKYLSRNLDITLDYTRFIRSRNTPKQEGLSPTARKKNIRNAFSIKHSNQNVPEIVAIIDDVVTTTASTRELIKLLRHQGVKEIHIWSLARACKKTSNF